MTNTPIQDVWFDDAATSAMGEAFDRACVSLGASRGLQDHAACATEA